MGWFWAEKAAPPAQSTPPNSSSIRNDFRRPQAPIQASPEPQQSACPYVPPEGKTISFTETITSTNTSSRSQPSDSTISSTLSKLNPLNYMPASISQSRAPNQKICLPIDRETSTIPKGDGSGNNWEYPSPQQMYNAMLRKGYSDTPEDAVESMVAVHNFLNEGAWNEIRGWESLFHGGILDGWKRCSSGQADASNRGLADDDERLIAMRVAAATETRQQPEPRLARFMGRPGDMTPKATMLQALGWLYPARFEREPPFDRHDWFVQRTSPDGTTSEVRYVIDYYSDGSQATGEPVFYLDVRPAVDSPRAALERSVRWGGDFWWRASGGVAREVRRREEAETGVKVGFFDRMWQR